MPVREFECLRFGTAISLPRLRNSASGHNLFCDNLFRISDKRLIVEVARPPVKRSETRIARQNDEILVRLR